MQRKSFRKRCLSCCPRAAVLCVIVLLAAVTASAQLAGTGSIQGTVSDPSGAIVQKASVTLTDVATGIKHATNSGADGLYSFPNLAVGTYTLAVTASGFERYSRSNIVLEVGSSIGINVTMTVGASSQNVEVNATSLALQTEDPSFKQTIDSRSISELPLNGREMTSLITLSGGSAPAPANDIQGSKSFYSSVVISVAGGMGNMTDYRLDGADHNDYMTNINLPFPFPDAVSQFSVETTALGATSGLHPGGLVNVVTKSGTNQFHGDAFEFIRNNFIDATNFYSVTKDTLHQNQYGGTLGGPIVRDKLFFFAGYQHLKADQTQASTEAYVPTAANLAGNFSATDGPGCESSGTGVQLLNPLTGAVLPNNMINSSAFVAPALVLQKYLPVTTNQCGLVSYAIPDQQSENVFVTRVDYTISQKDSVYGRYFLDGYGSPAFFSPTNVLITTQPQNEERAQSLTLAEIHIFSPNLVNTVHATGTRRRDNRGAASEGISPATLGINMYVPAPNFLELSLTNKWSTYCGTCAAGAFNVNLLSGSDDATWMHGRHQFSFGGEFVWGELHTNNAYEDNGMFTFTGVYSQNGPAGASTGGTGADANLDFLTGALEAFQQSKVDGEQNSLHAPIPSLYFQDTYHANQKLVISAGIRWDPWFQPVDRFHRGTVFNMTDFLDNVHSVVFPNAPAGALYYGDKGVLPGFTKNSPWQFTPRLGITYDPTGQGITVFRLGTALIYDSMNFYTGNRLNDNPPYNPTISNVPENVPLSFASPWSNGSTPYNPFPVPFTPTAASTFPPQEQFVVLPPHFHPPYVMQWTASMQHELAHNWQFQIDYIGNKTSFDDYGFPLNPAVYIPGTCGTAPCSSTGNTSSRFLLTRENPVSGPIYQGGGSGSTLIASGANASYNGMIATIQHRMSSDFSFLANYTWSHCIDIEDAQGDISSTTVEDPYNIKLDRANCGFDYRNIFNSSLLALSKFNLTGWKKQVINNWELAPLLTIRDGTPFNVTSGVDNSLTDIGNDRPNLLVSRNAAYTHVKLTSASIGGNRNYLNAADFAQNASGTYGNLGRNAFRGPAYVELDSELSRYFALTQRFKLDFRLEAFNVLNHPYFNTPGTTAINSSSFGQITSTLTTSSTVPPARIFQGAIKLIF